MAEPQVRVLLVDDDEDEYLITRDLFREMGRGYALEWARSYDEALEEMRRDCRDAYLVDYHLGPHTGVELLREAKAGGCKSPILILTGAGDRAVDLEAMQAGAADYLDKAQLTAALLERSVRYAIERRRVDEKLKDTDAQRRRLHAVFVRAPAMVNILLGPQHVFDLVHPLTRELLGRDVSGLPLAEAVPELRDLGLIEMMDHVYRTGDALERHAMLLALHKPDGSRRELFLDITLLPWPDEEGRITGVMTFGVDVTDAVLARRRIEEHVRKLQRVEGQLQEAVRTRDEFLSIASHELKTPLTPLSLQIDQLRKVARRAKGIDPALLSLLETAKRQTGKLAGLVENLLDVSRIATARLALQVEEVDLAQVAREVAERFRPQAEAARSSLSVDGEEPVVGRWDRFRLEQVISNLLSNAIKYGRGKPIVVRVSAAEDTARLSVQDEGIGIEQGDVGRIFERFERAVSSRHYGGLGLGLYIAHEIVEAHGGSILVHSRPGAGSTFTVVLPVRPEAEAGPPAVQH